MMMMMMRMIVVVVRGITGCCWLDMVVMSMRGGYCGDVVRGWPCFGYYCLIGSQKGEYMDCYTHKCWYYSNY